MTSSLIFDGTLELCDPDGHVSSEDYWFEALAEGTSFGDPQPVEVGMASLMRDGAIVEKTGDQNRETVFVIKVKGPDSAALDAGVAALHRATGKRTTLLWTPPDGYGDPRIWDVETSNLLEPNGFDDLAYAQRNEQTFRLRLVCQPFRRGTTLIVDDAGTPPSTGGTLLLNCESTTGWARFNYPGTSSSSGGVSGVFAVDSVIFAEGAGSLKSRMSLASWDQGYDGHYAYGSSQDEVTGLTLDTDAGGYLSVKVRIEHEDLGIIAGVPGLRQVWMQVGGTWSETDPPVAVSRDDLGFVRYVWPVDASLTVTGLRFSVLQARAAQFVPAPYAWYDEVELLPSATTDKQIVKQLEVQGSARTTGSLHIAAPSDSIALGQVLVATVPTSEIPAGAQINTAQWVTQGTTTVDAAAIAGIYYTPNTSYASSATYPIFDVPISTLAVGTYMAVALVKAMAPSINFGVQAQVRMGSTDVGPTSAAETSPQGLTTGWQLVTVGSLELPPLPVYGADADTVVRLLFKATDAKLADVFLIPARQVGGRAVADFTIMDCGTGTVEPGGSSSNAWIDSPSVLNDGLGAWSRGPTSDRANSQRLSRATDLKKPGTHVFPPGSLTAFLVSTNAAGPTLALEYFDRWL